MRLRFPNPTGSLTALFITAAIALTPAVAFADDPQPVPPKREKKLPPEPRSKLPKVGADRSRGLDFLFGALKAAPDEASAKHVEARIWALWLQTPSDTAALLMARAKAAIDLFLAENLDAVGGVKNPLVAAAAKDPGLRVIDGNFMVIGQAAGVPRARENAVRYLHDFIEEMKRSGFVAKALAASGVTDATVAP